MNGKITQLEISFEYEKAEDAEERLFAIFEFLLREEKADKEDIKSINSV